jgi:hypothetical protein
MHCYKPVPKCFPIKNSISGGLIRGASFATVGKDDATAETTNMIPAAPNRNSEVVAFSEISTKHRAFDEISILLQGGDV